MRYPLPVLLQIRWAAEQQLAELLQDASVPDDLSDLLMPWHDKSTRDAAYRLMVARKECQMLEGAS